MDSAAAAYIVACGISALLAGVEQYNRLESRFTLRRRLWAWWAARLALDAGIGALSVAIVRTYMSASGVEALLLWIGAGAGASAIVRARFLEVGRGEELRAFGPVTVYDRVRGFIERHIDDLGAADQARWLNEILGKLSQKGVAPEEIAERLRAYIRGLGRLPRSDRATELTFVTKTLRSTQKPRVKRETLVKYAALKLRAYKVLEEIARGNKND